MAHFCNQQQKLFHAENLYNWLRNLLSPWIQHMFVVYEHEGQNRGSRFYIYLDSEVIHITFFCKPPLAWTSTIGHNPLKKTRQAVFYFIFQCVSMLILFYFVLKFKIWYWKWQCHSYIKNHEAAKWGWKGKWNRKKRVMYKAHDVCRWCTDEHGRWGDNDGSSCFPKHEAV